MMDKFSVYDILGLILPGAFFVFFANFMLAQTDYSCMFNNAGNAETLTISLVFSIIFGALFFVTSYKIQQSKCGWFENLKKYKWFAKFNSYTSMYVHVFDLYFQNKLPHVSMNKAFNEVSEKWFGSRIFHDKSEIENKYVEKKYEVIKRLHDQFYDRMYYELEYSGKIDSPKAFHSFYFFFRQISVACCTIYIMSLIFYLYSLIDNSFITGDINYMFLIFIFIIHLISRFLAKWYRQRMVFKIYWAYFTHLNNNLK